MPAPWARCSDFCLPPAFVTFAAGFASGAASAATQTAAENATITAIISFFISFSSLLNYLTSFVMAPPVAMPSDASALGALLGLLPATGLRHLRGGLRVRGRIGRDSNRRRERHHHRHHQFFHKLFFSSKLPDLIRHGAAGGDAKAFQRLVRLRGRAALLPLRVLQQLAIEADGLLLLAVRLLPLRIAENGIRRLVRKDGRQLRERRVALFLLSAFAVCLDKCSE